MAWKDIRWGRQAFFGALFGVVGYIWAWIFSKMGPFVATATFSAIDINVAKQVVAGPTTPWTTKIIAFMSGLVNLAGWGTFIGFIIGGVAVAVIGRAIWDLLGKWPGRTPLGQMWGMMIWGGLIMFVLALIFNASAPVTILGATGIGLAIGIYYLLVTATHVVLYKILQKVDMGADYVIPPR